MTHLSLTITFGIILPALTAMVPTLLCKPRVR